MSAIELREGLEKLGGCLVRADRFLPPNIRDELSTALRALTTGAGELQAKLDALQDDDFVPVTGRRVDLFEGGACEAAEALAEWARGEDPAKVTRVLDAIRGGVSDLSLVF